MTYLKTSEAYAFWDTVMRMAALSVGCKVVIYKQIMISWLILFPLDIPLLLPLNYVSNSPDARCFCFYVVDGGIRYMQNYNSSIDFFHSFKSPDFHATFHMLFSRDTSHAAAKNYENSSFQIFALLHHT